jgi:hypothetical protein
MVYDCVTVRHGMQGFLQGIFVGWSSGSFDRSSAKEFRRNRVSYILLGPILQSLSLRNNIYKRCIAPRERFGFIEGKQNAIRLDYRLTRNISQMDARVTPP